MVKLQYTPSDDEKKRITFIQNRYRNALNYFKSNYKSRFDKYYKNSLDYNWDRAKLLAEQNKEWASNTFVPLTSWYLRWVLPKVIDSSPEIKVTWRRPDDMGKAEKVQTLLSYIWDKNPMEKELKKFNLQALRYWTGIWKVLWKKKSIKSTKAVVDDENLEIKDVSYVEDEFDDPAFETIDIYWFFPDPQWYDIDSCRYVCQRYLMTKEQFFKTYWKDNLMNTEYVQASTWDLTILSNVRNEVSSLKNWWAAVKATKEQLEVIEYWEDDKFCILAWWVLVKDDVNPFPFKKKPYLKTCYEDIEFQFYWTWIPEQLSHIQDSVNKLRNQRADTVSMWLQQMFIINDAAVVDTRELEMRPWWLIRALWQDMDSVIHPVQMPTISPSSYNEDDLSAQDARTATWLDAYSIWQSQAASSSASSVIASKEASALRVKNYVRSLETEVYEPMIRMWLDLAKEFYPNDILEQVYDENWNVVDTVAKMPLNVSKNENWKITFQDIMKNDLGWYFDFRVLSDSWIAASKELSKQNSLQLLDRAASIWTNPQTWEQYVDVKALWKSTLVDFDKDPESLMWFNTQQSQWRQDQWLALTQQQQKINQMQQMQWLAQWWQWWWQWWKSIPSNPISNQVNWNLAWINAPNQQ